MINEALSYSENGLLNRVLFFASSNDINIYVEDAGKEYEYETIFMRLLGDKFKISKIFPMGGKSGVERAFKEYGLKREEKYNIYIVDGDFDVLLEKKMILSPNYIYLKKYNIESYYIDKEAVVSYMVGKLKKQRAQVEDIIKYDEWENDTYTKLQALFLCYLIVQKKIPEQANVGESEYSYLDRNGCVDMGKINKYEEKIKQRMQNYDNIYRKYMKKFNTELRGDASNLVCGKYVFASLIQYLRQCTNKRIREEDFKYYLISKFEIHKLDYIKERIIQVCQATV